jgi:hypothetical protein
MKEVNADRRVEERALAAEFKEKLAGLDRYTPAPPAFSSIERQSRVRWAPSVRGSARSTFRLRTMAAVVAVLFTVALAGSWGLGRLDAPHGASSSEASEVSSVESASPANSPGASASHLNSPEASASPAIASAVVAPIPTGGTATAAAPWYAHEVYYLYLMNCTRTGGWVTDDGKCSSNTNHTLPAQSPLVLDEGISDKVARPYARLLAERSILDHLADHDPAWRLCFWGGLCGGSWGENLASPWDDMVAVEIFYQNEAFCRCGHYANIMDPSYHRVGIGVWQSTTGPLAGRWLVVFDFYS